MRQIKAELDCDATVRIEIGKDRLDDPIGPLEDGMVRLIVVVDDVSVFFHVDDDGFTEAAPLVNSVVREVRKIT